MTFVLYVGCGGVVRSAKMFSLVKAVGSVKD